MITHLALDGVLEGGLGVGIDVTDTAAKITGDGNRVFRQRVVSTDGLPVRSGAGRTISVDGEPAASEDFGPGDILVIPGPSASTETGVDRLLTGPGGARAVELILGAAANGATVAASCSATFVLAASGLLSKRRATTTWWLAPLFARRFPDVTLLSDRMVVDSGTVLTAGTAFAHADLMLALVARLGGPELAEDTARYLLLDARLSQSRYMVLEHLRSADPALRAVEEHVHANLDRRLTLGELAGAASISPRTLTRRTRECLGVSPIEFVHRLRVSAATQLLTTTRQPVDAVATAVGYADPAAFRRIYRRHTGESPSSTRSRAKTGLP
ncbi:helix-turn-helix domain-containing protein [Amycolatopsis sp. NPDC051071]|uniref:GlxA family transcriptional regulator n=1 Tax=Amycolatopsis sp. NPDC051071 TaxID=3154637 RepID=UPI0034286B48